MFDDTLITLINELPSTNKDINQLNIHVLNKGVDMDSRFMEIIYKADAIADYHQINIFAYYDYYIGTPSSTNGRFGSWDFVEDYTTIYRGNCCIDSNTNIITNHYESNHANLTLLSYTADPQNEIIPLFVVAARSLGIYNNNPVVTYIIDMYNHYMLGDFFIYSLGMKVFKLMDENQLKSYIQYMKPDISIYKDGLMKESIVTKSKNTYMSLKHSDGTMFFQLSALYFEPEVMVPRKADLFRQMEFFKPGTNNIILNSLLIDFKFDCFENKITAIIVNAAPGKEDLDKVIDTIFYENYGVKRMVYYADSGCPEEGDIVWTFYVIPYDKTVYSSPYYMASTIFSTMISGLDLRYGCVEKFIEEKIPE
jgi:hypothetical protein